MEVINRKGQRIHDRIYVGDERSVSFDKADIEWGIRYKNYDRRDIAILHNHPADITLSPADVVTTLSNGFGLVMATTPNNGVFVAEVDALGFSDAFGNIPRDDKLQMFTKEYYETVEDADPEVINVSENSVARGDNFSIDRYADASDEAWRRMATKHEWLTYYYIPPEDFTEYENR
jgi:hypothetical protein